MRILLDQDEVLAQWNQRILEWYNEDYKTSLKRTDIKDYWMEGLLGPQGRDFIRSCIRWPEFYTDLEPVEGAVRGVKKLIDDGHDVLIVTSIPSSAGIALHGKCQWLRKHMPFFPLKNLIACHRKDLVVGDILLDDGPHNIKVFEQSGRPAVIMDAPYNQDVKASFRVHHWNEFLDLIDKIGRKP